MHEDCAYFQNGYCMARNGDVENFPFGECESFLVKSPDEEFEDN